jgi:2-oxoglutarate dehydrogenase E1 component
MRLDEFSGFNAGYVLELYERYRQNPQSVDPQTRGCSRRGHRRTEAPATVERQNAGLMFRRSSAPQIWRSAFAGMGISPRDSIRLALNRSAIRPCLPRRTALQTADLRALPASLVGGP